jgi:hypothetical protein
VRFGGVIALCREDHSGLSMDPAGLDVSRLPGSTVVFGEKTADGRVGAVLGVVDKAMVIPLEGVPGTLEQPAIGPDTDTTCKVVYVEWETGGGKAAVDFEKYEACNWGPFSMGCEGRMFEKVGDCATKVSITQAVVQPLEVAADKLQTLWRIPG